MKVFEFLTFMSRTKPRKNEKFEIWSQVCGYLSQTLAPSIGGTLCGFFKFFVMWAFLTNICLHSDSHGCEMYITGNTGLRLTWNFGGFVEIV